MKQPLLQNDESLLPDRKAQRNGIGSLTDAELMSVIIRTGVPGCNAIQLCERILQELGGLSFLITASPEHLRSIPGLGTVKTIQLQAVGELSKRIWNSRRDLSEPLVNSETVYRFFCEEMRFAMTEEVHLALLDVKCRLLRHVVLTKGTLRSSQISPREIFETAFRYNAASFILLHNHPSGDPTPSSDDNYLTSMLYQLSNTMQLPMLDHIIVGELRYYSYKDHDRLR